MEMVTFFLFPFKESQIILYRLFRPISLSLTYVTLYPENDIKISLSF